MNASENKTYLKSTEVKKKMTFENSIVLKVEFFFF